MQFLKKSIIILFLSLFWVFPALSSDKKPSAAEGRSKAAGVRYPLSLTDSAGQTVKLEKPPERIVVIGRGPYMSLHILYMFPEAKHRIVGMESRKITVKAFLSLIDPLLSKKKILGMYPGPEMVAALNPDLVIMKGYTVQKITRAFNTLGIPVVHVGLETPEQFFQDVKNLGLILNNPSRADEITAFYRKRLDRFDRIAGQFEETKKPRVLVLEYSTRGNKAAVKVPARTWIQTLQTLRTGGRPVWLESSHLTDGWTIVHFEQIAAWDPDKIFVIVWYSEDPKGVIRTLKNDPHWKMLRAVKAGEIYAFPSDIIGWDTPEPRWILGMTWMALNILPGHYPDLDLQQEIFAYFNTLYGMDRESIRTSILPAIRFMPEQ